MNFSERFKEICEEIKRQTDSLKEPVILTSLPKEIKHEQYTRYAIRKRSLPVGIDTLVMTGLRKTEAENLLKTLLKSKVKDIDGVNQVTYYDVVREDGTNSGVFDNPSEVIKEDLWID